MNTDTYELHLTERFVRAVDYARVLHIERRKGTGIPYMAHLLGVASLVMGEAGHVAFPVTEEMVIAALLHDAVEDHGGERRLHDIRQNFGEDVARMVEGLSDTLAEDPQKKEPWLERKQAYVKRLGERAGGCAAHFRCGQALQRADDAGGLPRGGRGDLEAFQARPRGPAQVL